jgi:hypothetical protein
MAALSRRGLFGLGLGAAALAATAPAFAVDKGYEAMLVKCSQFNIAGGPIGVVAPAFAKWHDTYWDNLAISVQLHNVKRVVGITHRDCGAAAVAYGDKIKTDKAYETAMNTQALQQFRTEVKKRQPQVIVELGIMDLNGAVEPVT